MSQPRGKRTSGTGRQDAALLTPYLVGPDGQLFGDPMPALDETSFQVDNTSEAYYNSPYYTQHENDILAIPVPAPTAPLELESVIGADFLAPIVNGNKISFHVVGDTGASESSAITTEASVADAMAAALVAAPPADAPAFFFHLGDVIYNFGEAQYYYDQFYEPFRAYDRPIFAIPGNHDGEVTYINGGSTPDVPTLQAFIANFCTPAPARPASAGGLVRTTMTQPGVYFTLDAPFVSIIGLYTNVLEGPGVLTDQGGMYPTLTGDAQYGWLVSELERLKPQRTALDRAVILACHHPPASADTVHGGSTGLSQDLDRAFAEAGLWPDVILSGHAHVYQRFTRTVNGKAMPYIVAGSGGHARSVPLGETAGEAPRTWNDFTLEVGPVLEFGYLTVTVDMRAPTAPLLTIAFSAPSDPAAADSVSVNLN